MSVKTVSALLSAMMIAGCSSAGSIREILRESISIEPNTRWDFSEKYPETALQHDKKRQLAYECRENGRIFILRFKAAHPLANTFNVLSPLEEYPAPLNGKVYTAQEDETISLITARNDLRTQVAIQKEKCSHAGGEDG